MKEWIAGKLIRAAFKLMDEDTRNAVSYCLYKAAQKGLLKDL